MNEEIRQIERNKTWTLVPRPKGKNVIRTKWVFRNKLNEEGEVTRKKSRVVCKGYSQEEGIDYGKTFAPIARLEGVRSLLTYAAYKDFKVNQMDVKFGFIVQQRILFVQIVTSQILFSSPQRMLYKDHHFM